MRVPFKVPFKVGDLVESELDPGAIGLVVVISNSEAGVDAVGLRWIIAGRRYRHKECDVYFWESDYKNLTVIGHVDD